MKKFVLLIFFSVSLTISFAQVFTKPNNSFGTISNRQSNDSAQYLPTFAKLPTDTTDLHSQGFGGAGQKLLKAAEYYDSLHHHFYIWDPSLKAWIRIDSSSGGSITWGSITGLLTNQTDLYDSLQNRLLTFNNLSDLTNVTTARTNLGLGSLAVLNSINNTNWSGQVLSLTNGGTGLNAGGAAFQFLQMNSGATAAQWVTVNYLSGTLTSAHIFVGNGSNIATDVAVSGDLTLANTGAFTIASNVVTYAKFQQIVANKLFGNPTGSTANGQAIGLGFGLGFSGTSLIDTATHLSSYINDLPAPTLNQVLASGNTATNKSMFLQDASGNSWLDIEPGTSSFAAMQAFTAASVVAAVVVDNSDSIVTIGGNNGIFIGEPSGSVGVLPLKQQASQMGSYNLYWPQMARPAGDTIATLEDIRLGSIPTLDQVLGAGGTSTGKDVELNDGSGNTYFHYNVSSKDVSIGDIGFANNGTFIDVADNASTISIRAASGVIYEAGAIGTPPMTLFNQFNGGTGSGKAIYLPYENAVDTLATKADVRAGGGSATTLYTGNGSIGSTRTVTLSNTLSFAGTNTTSTFATNGNLTMLSTGGTGTRTMQITNTVAGDGYNALNIRSDVGQINFEITHVNPTTTGFGGSITYYTNSSDTGTLLATGGYDYPNGMHVYLTDMRGPTNRATIEDNSNEFVRFMRFTHEEYLEGSLIAGDAGGLLNSNGYAIQSQGSAYIWDSLFVGRTPAGTAGTDSILVKKHSDSSVRAISPSYYLTSNQSITWTASGDVSGSASGTTSISPSLTVTAIQNKSITLATGYLKYNGSAWTFDNSTFLTSAFYQTVQANTTSQTQRNKLNFSSVFSVSDNSGNGSTDVTIGSATITNAMLAGSIAASKLIGTDITTVGTITSGGLGTGAVIGLVTMTLGSDANYDIYYRNSSGVLTRLANGTTGQFLGANTSAAPSWQTPSGSAALTTNDIGYGIASVLGGTSNFTFDGTTATLTHNSLGTTTATGWLINNTTAAANGSAQVSPTLTLETPAWGTTAGTSQTTDLAMSNQSAQGTTPLLTYLMTGKIASNSALTFFKLSQTSASTSNYYVTMQLGTEWQMRYVGGGGMQVSNIAGGAGFYFNFYDNNFGTLFASLVNGGTYFNTKTTIGSNSSPTSTLTVVGSLGHAFVSKATSYTTTISDEYVEVTATGQTETLPTAVGITGRTYTIKLTASGSSTVATTSSQTIDGSTTYSLTAQYKYVTVISNGSNWDVVANNDLRWLIIPIIPMMLIRRQRKDFYQSIKMAA